MELDRPRAARARPELRQAHIAAQLGQARNAIVQPFVETDRAVAIEVGLAPGCGQPFRRQRVAEQPLPQLGVFQRDIVGLGRGEDADALVVGELAEPAVAHRPRLEPRAGDAGRGMAGIDDQGNLRRIDRAEIPRQLGGRQQVAQFGLAGILKKSPVGRDQIEIALRVGPAVPGKRYDDDIVGGRLFEHLSIDAILLVQPGKHLGASAAGHDQREHPHDRDVVDRHARPVGQSLAGQGQPAHLVARNIVQPFGDQPRIGNRIVQAEALGIIIVDPDRYDVRLRLARDDRRALISESRRFAFYPVFVEGVSAEFLLFGARGGGQRNMKFDAVRRRFVRGVSHDIELAPLLRRIGDRVGLVGGHRHNPSVAEQPRIVDSRAGLAVGGGLVEAFAHLDRDDRLGGVLALADPADRHLRRHPVEAFDRRQLLEHRRAIVRRAAVEQFAVKLGLVEIAHESLRAERLPRRIGDQPAQRAAVGTEIGVVTPARRDREKAVVLPQIQRQLLGAVAGIPQLDLAVFVGGPDQVAGGDEPRALELRFAGEPGDDRSIGSIDQFAVV